MWYCFLEKYGRNFIIEKRNFALYWRAYLGLPPRTHPRNILAMPMIGK